MLQCKKSWGPQMVQGEKKGIDSGGAPCIRGKDRSGRWKLKPHWYCLSWQGLIASLIFDSKVAPFSNTHTSRDGEKSISANNIRDGFIQLRISSSRWCHSPAFPQSLSGFCCDIKLPTKKRPVTLQRHKLWSVNQGLVYCKQQGAIPQDGVLCHCQRPQETQRKHEKQIQITKTFLVKKSNCKMVKEMEADGQPHLK